MALLKNYDLEFTTHEPEILDVPKVELVEPDEFSFVSPEDDAVEIQVCNGQFVLPCVTNNTAISTVFEEQEVPHDLVQEAFSNVRVKLSYLIGTLPCMFLTFLSLLILGSGRYHHLRA
jgi:hypothetical protein